MCQSAGTHEVFAGPRAAGGAYDTRAPSDLFAPPSNSRTIFSASRHVSRAPTSPAQCLERPLASPSLRTVSTWSRRGIVKSHSAARLRQRTASCGARSQVQIPAKLLAKVPSSLVQQRPHTTSTGAAATLTVSQAITKKQARPQSRRIAAKDQPNDHPYVAVACCSSSRRSATAC